MSYVRTLTICLLLVNLVSAAGCHCFDLHMEMIYKVRIMMTNGPEIIGGNVR